MKPTTLFIASIILVTCNTTFADKPKTTDNKASKKKAETIELLLAEKNLAQGKVAKRIRTYNIDTWRRLDNYHIFIEGKGKNKDYLIKFKNKCYKTRNGSTLIYKTNNNELTKFDSIGVLDSFINSHDVMRPTHSCIIEDIYHLNNLTSNESMTEEKTKKKSNN